MNNAFLVKNKVPVVKADGIKYLSESQINDLTKAFKDFYDSAEKFRKSRGRYFLAFLFLRYTGARLQEVLNIDDVSYIDYRHGEIKLLNEKRRNKKEYRQVPVLANVLSELARYLMEYQDMKGKAFSLHQGNFRRTYYDVCEQAGLPRELSHPHVLRHTRAIELLMAGVTITAVQQLLGHSSITTTAIYLRLSGQEIKLQLKEKGLI